MILPRIARFCKPKRMEEEKITTQTRPPVGETTGTAAEATGTAGEVTGTAAREATGTTTSAPSRRDAFRERVSKRYPDLNMDDEDAYYEQMGKTMDEYEGYENNSRRLREAMERSPEMAKMLVAAQGQDNFDPIAYLFENANADILALAEDPEGAKKFGELRSQQLSRQAEGEEIKKSVEDNMPSSIEAVTSKAQELGLSDEQTQEIVGQMFQVMDDLVHGKIDPEIFAMMAKGKDYDNAVEQARDEGKAEGLNTKVTDKLRTLENKQEHVSGVQTPMKTAAPKKKVHNMFVESEDDEEY